MIEEKRFIKPKAEVVEFDNADIIVTSAGDRPGGIGIAGEDDVP